MCITLTTNNAIHAYILNLLYSYIPEFFFNLRLFSSSLKEIHFFFLPSINRSIAITLLQSSPKKNARTRIFFFLYRFFTIFFHHHLHFNIQILYDISSFIKEIYSSFILTLQVLIFICSYIELN